MANVFISYSREDKDFAWQLAEDLERLGIEIWIDKNDIPISGNWRKAVTEALDLCELMLVIMSPSSKESEYVTAEWAYFLDNGGGKLLIPIRFRPTNIIELSRRNYIDFVAQDYKTAFRQLELVLQQQGITHPLYSEIRRLAADYSGGNEDAIEWAKHLLLGEFRDLLLSVGYGEVDKLRKCLVGFVTRDLAGNCAGDKLLAKVRFWLEDELILVYPKSRAYIDDLKARLLGALPSSLALTDLQSVPDDLADDSLLCFDIEFKSEYIKNSGRYKEGYEATAHDPISLVAQCMFVICHQNGFFYTVHDRSYAGAEDRLSKYAMITGRLAAKDLKSPVLAEGTMVKLVCHSTLHRELQELDELGLSSTSAAKYINENNLYPGLPRTQFVGVYEAQGGKVLSFLFAVFVTVDEYNNDLTKRGPYLLPVSPTEFSKLRTLNLLNDILHRNSCSYCLGEGQGAFACALGRDRQDSCIVRDIRNHINDETLARFETFDIDKNRDKNIVKYRTRLGCNSVIVAVDIPEYSLLDTDIIQGVRQDLERLIQGFLANFATHTHSYEFWIQPTSKGYIVVLRTSARQRFPTGSADGSNLALVAYFFSLYLSMVITDISLWQLETGQGLQYPDIRIGLHMDDLPSDNDGGIYFAGNGVNQTLDIVSIGQPRQILCSQSFTLHLLSDLQDHGVKVVYSEGTLHDATTAHGIWTAAQLGHLLRSLGLAAAIIRDIVRDKSLIACFEQSGIPLSDFGFFTQENGLRYRVFNLGVFHSTDTDQDLLDYGNGEQPIVRVPIIYRTKNTTNNELNKLVESLHSAEHLMMYGYSNVRMMREIYRTYIRDQKPENRLKTFTVIFYDYAQYQELNETRALEITQANWIRGFLYAQQIAEAFKGPTSDCKVGVNGTRYGFNVFKVIYAANAPVEYKDHIRFTVPMPGRAFELSPVFVINRGDPLYHRFLEVCERYVEEGIKENSDNLSVTEYSPNARGYEILERLFGATPTDINGVDEAEYWRLVKGKSANKDAASGKARKKLGEHYVELIAENDFVEACRLWECLQLLRENSSGAGFNYQQFLGNFLP